MKGFVAGYPLCYNIFLVYWETKARLQISKNFTVPTGGKFKLYKLLKLYADH